MKKFAIGTCPTYPAWKTLVEEASKCHLLCGNCHFEAEHGFRDPNTLELYEGHAV
jgi:hypothetical protein